MATPDNSIEARLARAKENGMTTLANNLQKQIDVQNTSTPQSVQAPQPATPPSPQSQSGYSQNSPFTASFPVQAPQSQTPTDGKNQNTQTNQGQNQNTMTGVNGEVFQLVNNPDLTPRQNTQTTPQTPQATQINQPNWNIGTGREQELVNNINEGLKNDSRVQQAVQSGDWDAFSKLYGYDTADTTKQRILKDQWDASTNYSQDSLFRGLVNGNTYANSVTEKPEYRQAQMRADKYSQYSGYSVNELAQAMKSGELIQGTQEYKDLMANPATAEKLQRAKAYTGQVSLDLVAVGDRVNSEIAQTTPVTQSMFADGVVTPDEYQQALLTPEITAKMGDVETKKNKYDKLKAEYDQIEQDVENDSRYSGLSAYAKRALVANGQKKLQYALQISADEYNNAVGTLSEMQKTQASILEMNYSMYQQERAFNQQKEMAQFASDLSVQQDQRLYEQKLAQQAQAMNDPNLAIPELLNEYKKIGVNTQRSTQEIIQEAQQFMANGGTLGDYMTHLNGLMQGKDEYKKYQALQMGQMSDYDKMQLGQQYDMQKMAASQQYGRENMALGYDYDMQKLMAQYNISTAQGRQDIYDKLVYEKGMNPNEAKAYVNYTQKGGVAGILEECRTSGQCGSFANDYLEKLGLGRLMKNQYSEKKAYVNSSTPAVGSLAIWQPTGKAAQPQYGHVGVVTAINGDQVTITDTNWDGKGTQMTHTVSASTINGTGGFYNPFGLTTVTQEKGISTEAQSWVNTWNSGALDLEKILTKIGSSKEGMALKNEVIKAIDAQGGVAWRKESDPAVGKVQEIINRIEKSKNSSYINTIGGNVQTSLTNWATGGKSDLLADLKFVLEGNVLQELIDAKANGATFGALSNEELKMLQSSSSALAANARRDKNGNIVGFNMSEKKLKEELEKMQQLFTEKKNRMTGAGVSQNPTNNKINGLTSFLQSITGSAPTR